MSSPSQSRRPSASASRTSPRPSAQPSPRPTPRPSGSSSRRPTSSARPSLPLPLNPSNIPSGIRPSGSNPALSTTTITSTLHPVTTLSVPHSVPVTDALGVSRVVITHIVANPTSSVTSASNGPSFFQDQAKTAGVFLVVGIVVTAFIFGLIFCFRRRRRESRQKEWLATIPHHHDGDPFADPRPVSLVRETSRPTNRSSIWDGRRVPVPEYFSSEMPIPSQPPLPPHPPPPAPIFRPNMPPPPPPRNPNHRVNATLVPMRLEDWREEMREHSPVGVAITTDKREFNRSRASLMSSPSIYPQSLPGGDDDDAISFYEMEANKHTASQQRHHVIFPAPVRRSNDLYQPAKTKQTRTTMLTPPLTDDSSTPPSPDFDRRRMILPPESSVFQKPTLLNVRRRETFGRF